MYDAELAELATLRAQLAGGGRREGHAAREIERKLKDICDAALERNIDVHDNLFEIGASSLKLIEIHEQIDRIYPGTGRPHRAVRLPDHRRAVDSTSKASWPRRPDDQLAVLVPGDPRLRHRRILSSARALRAVSGPADEARPDHRRHREQQRERQRGRRRRNDRRRT